MSAAMKQFTHLLVATLACLFWLALVPFLFALLALSSILGRVLKARRVVHPPVQFPAETRPACSIVIPNWNGKDLLEKFLPAVVAACDFSIGDEVIVVDNASEDGSSDWMRANHPQVRVLQPEKNLGFGGGCNAGIRAANNRIVVLLNNDMRVLPDFLDGLVAPFREPDVFAVSSQILFSDPNKRREETGLTYARFRNWQLELGHDIDCDSESVLPCFYPGGGSSAFDRERLLELGGFDHLYRPFYLEDTDLGFEAWRRGWRVLYQPSSVVYHEHRGTIGKRFSPLYVASVISKNRLLFQWKNFQDLRLLAPSLLRLGFDLFDALISPSQENAASPAGFFRAILQFPEAVVRRFVSSRHAHVPDREALARHNAAVYYDRYLHRYREDRPLRVLFVSPYPLFPPLHGGAVLITQTLEYLRKHCDVHLVVILEDESEYEAHQAMADHFASLHLVVRRSDHRGGRLGFLPKAVREFDLEVLHSLLPRLIYDYEIDVIQLEYTQIAQYAGRYQSLLAALFEHDVYFQTVERRLLTAGASSGPKTLLEYLRALRYELRVLKTIDYVQVCTPANAQYLRQFIPSLNGRLDATLRAGIQLANYPYSGTARREATLLFVGNFRHTPNREGLTWLLEQVMPTVLARRTEVILRVVGANAASMPLPSPLPTWLDLKGEVPSVTPHLRECTLFVCPVLTGSGVRVKLLEAYASGIPVVSTSIGAEGITGGEEPVCRVADDPKSFANEILFLLDHPEQARQLAQAARRLVEKDWDAEANTERLERRYRELLLRKQAALMATEN